MIFAPIEAIRRGTCQAGRRLIVYDPQLVRMMKIFCLTIGILGILLMSRIACAQQTPDTTRSDTTRSGIIDNIKDGQLSQQIMKSITRKQPSDPVAAVKSEAAFMPYEGKIIRRIEVRQFDFQRTVYDTTKNIRNTITRLADKFHGSTKDRVIRNNLFVREGRPLNPYKLADNERYLRDLDFLLEAKFYVVPLEHTSDSVDLIVLTRDVFSLGASITPSNAKRTRFRLYDANLAGWGQRLQFNGLIDSDRHPNFTHEFLYRKNSIGGSFVNATVGYTQLNTGSSYGEEEEKAYYIRFDRPLVSPYTRYAGGMELSRNWSENFSSKHDTLFRDYRYVVSDFWIGYNIGAKSANERDRHFVAIRAFDQHFTRTPVSLREQERPLYYDQTFVLASTTFFRQDFYTASYIYGFGRTEDVPYGHNVSLTAGWARHRGISRSYVGLDAEKSIVSREGQFYTFGLRAGGFVDDHLEDATLLISGELRSRLIPKGRFLFRQSILVDYTRVYRQRTLLPLDINNDFGLQYFRADSLWGTKRFHILSETVAFSPWHLLGFRFAPFAFGEMAMIAPDHHSIFGDKPYFGFGGGIRTRNENLIFGTVELRFIYYPRTVEDISSFNIRVSSNLRIKYSAGFVRAPGFVQYN